MGRAPRRRSSTGAPPGADEAISLLNEILVVPATRTIRGILTEVELDETGCMPSGCALALDNVTSIAKGLLTERITTLGRHKLHQVCSALSAAVNC